MNLTMMALINAYANTFNVNHNRLEIVDVSNFSYEIQLDYFRKLGYAQIINFLFHLSLMFITVLFFNYGYIFAAELFVGIYLLNILSIISTGIYIVKKK